LLHHVILYTAIATSYYPNYNLNINFIIFYFLKVISPFFAIKTFYVFRAEIVTGTMQQTIKCSNEDILKRCSINRKYHRRFVPSR